MESIRSVPDLLSPKDLTRALEVGVADGQTRSDLKQACVRKTVENIDLTAFMRYLRGIVVPRFPHPKVPQ